MSLFSGFGSWQRLLLAMCCAIGAATITEMIAALLVFMGIFMDRLFLSAGLYKGLEQKLALH